jgi:hypothetical protein
VLPGRQRQGRVGRAVIGNRPSRNSARVPAPSGIMEVLMIGVAGFVAVILNPMVVYVQRRVRRRGWAVRS